MSARNQIEKFSQDATRSMIILGFIKGLARSFPLTLGSLIVLSALDKGVEIPIWGLRLLWLLVVGGAAALLTSGFVPFQMFSIREKARNLQKHSGSLREDELRLAIELARQQGGSTQELREVFLAQAAEKISACKPVWCFPSWNWRPAVIASLSVLTVGGLLFLIRPALFALSPNAVFPFSSQGIERSIRIEPGDAQVPLGHDASLLLTMLEASSKEPVLEVKTQSRWVPLEPETAAYGRYAYTIKKVTSPLYYRVLWKKESSRKFTLTPVEQAQFKSFQLKLTPPEYLGSPSAEQSSPEITGLAGSQVELEAEAGVEIEQAALMLADGREYRAIRIDDKKAWFRFAIDKDGSYSFSLTPKKSIQVKQEASYPIHVTQDQAPSITLLAPDQDVIVGQKEKLPLTFDARDDFGLSEAFLVWDSRTKGPGRVRIKRFENNVESVINTYEWSLADAGFPAGDLVRFQIEVWDKNSLTGPGKATTSWRLVEIKSFEADHAMIERALEAWRDKAMESLAQVTTLKKKVDAENPDMAAMTQSFDPAAQDLQMLESALKQIVDKMENDPLADYAVWMEHQKMEENMAVLNQKTAKEAQGAFRTQNKNVASEKLNEIANEIERMSALSESLTKTQNARDVLDSGERMEEIGNNLLETLQSAPPGEALEKIKELLNEAQKNLADMARALQQMPQDLPEDFVNQEALKNLELDKSQDILSQISEAVKRGDMKQAMALAQKFSEMAKSMRERLSKAHESFLESNSAEKLGQQIGEQQHALERITDEQRKILAETQKMSSHRLEETMKAQEDLLAQLAGRQEKVAKAAQPLAPVQPLVPQMLEVVGEFRMKRVEKSPGWLTAIIAQTGAEITQLNRSSASATMIENVGKIETEEILILEALKNPNLPKKELSSEEKDKHTELEKRQQDLRNQTQGVRQKLQELSRKTASLGPKMMESLKGAGDEMKNAANSLRAGDSPGAQGFEESALENLLDGQAQLGQAQMAMSGMAEEQGSGSEGEGGSGGRPKVIMRNGPGGGTGQQVGKVKLPTAEDYKPPKAFREDLLESLKENYPQIYEEIIHKYYKRLAE